MKSGFALPRQWHLRLALPHQAKLPFALPHQWRLYSRCRVVAPAHQLHVPVQRTHNKRKHAAVDDKEGRPTSSRRAA